MEEEVIKCLNVLQKGGVILYPTDTIWGIGCDATNFKAVERVYHIKRRTESKSLIILVNDEEMLKNYVQSVPETAWDLIRSYENPLTVIYSKSKNLSKNVYAGDGSIAIRIVKDSFCQEIIKRLKKPIVSTSANISGEPSPILFSKISDEIKKNVDYVVNLHQQRFNQAKPSTIIRLTNTGEFIIIRN